MSIKGSKGNELPLIDGFLFYPKDKDRKYFRCAHPGCAVTVIKNNQGEYNYGKHSTHQHQQPDLKKKNFHNYVKEEMKKEENQEKTVKELSNKIKRVSVNMTDDALEKMIQRQVKRKRDPIDYKGIEITEDEYQNVMFISKEKDVIVMGSIKMIFTLTRCKYIFMDGTFKSSPKQFKQLYTIHCGLHNNQTFPILFVLMSSRKSSDYNSLFEIIESVVKSFIGPLCLKEGRTVFKRKVVVSTGIEKAVLKALGEYN